MSTTLMKTKGDALVPAWDSLKALEQICNTQGGVWPRQEIAAVRDALNALYGALVEDAPATREP